MQLEMLAIRVIHVPTKHMCYICLFTVAPQSVPCHTSVSSLVDRGYTCYNITGINGSVLEK